MILRNLAEANRVPYIGARIPGPEIQHIRILLVLIDHGYGERGGQKIRPGDSCFDFKSNIFGYRRKLFTDQGGKPVTKPLCHRTLLLCR